MDKIRVCQIITKLELGGAQLAVLYTVSHLNKEQFEPILITGKGGVLDPEAAKLEGVKVFFASFLGRSINPILDFLGFVKLFRILIKLRPHVVHTNSSKAGILGRWAAFFARVPVIIHTVHGFGFNEFQKPFIRFVLVLAERLTAFITDKIVVVTSEDRKKGLKNRIGREEKYVVIRAGIDIDFYKKIAVNRDKKRTELGLLPGDRVLTTISPFKPQKNLKDFIRVAKVVSESRKDCRFVIVGDGQQRKELEKMVLENGLKDKMLFLGWRTDIAEILSISDVFVLTSLWEGLPRTILEAMCLKVPVVANAVDGIKEIIRDGSNGFLSESFNIEKMAGLVIRLLDNKDEAKAVAEKGYENVSAEFDLKYMLQKQENLYIYTFNLKKTRG